MLSNQSDDMKQLNAQRKNFDLRTYLPSNLKNCKCVKDIWYESKGCVKPKKKLS